MNNGRDDEFFVQERLDRVVANGIWCDSFPCVGVSTKIALSSDHAPVLVQLREYEVSVRKKHLFRFDARWEKNLECKRVIKQGVAC